MATPSTATRRAGRLRGDAGVIVVGWFVKLCVTLAILGVVGYDGVGIASAQLKVRDDSDQAAQLAYDEFKAHKNPQAAYDKVVALAKAQGETIPKGGFVIAADGSVTVRLQLKAKTVIAYRIPQLQEYVVAVGESTAHPQMI